MEAMAYTCMYLRHGLYLKCTSYTHNLHCSFVFTGMKAAPKCATAGEALRKCRSLLHEGILDPEGLASSLYSENIICRETLDRVLLDNTRRKKNLILLDAIEARLRTNSSDFNKFHAILDNDPHLRMFADALLGCYTTMPSKQVGQWMIAILYIHVNYLNLCHLSSIGVGMGGGRHRGTYFPNWWKCPSPSRAMPALTYLTTIHYKFLNKCALFHLPL